MGVYNQTYDNLGVKISNFLIGKITKENLLGRASKATYYLGDNLTFIFKFEKDKRKIAIKVNLPNSGGINQQSLEAVTDALYFSGFYERTKEPFDDAELKQRLHVIHGNNKDNDGYLIQVADEGMLIMRNMPTHYDINTLNQFFEKFANWTDYLTGKGFFIPEVIAPKWFANKLKRGIDDFSQIGEKEDIWTGLEGEDKNQYVAVTYGGLSQLKKTNIPYFVVHRGDEKAKLGLVINVAAGLTNKLLDDKFESRGDYWSGKIKVGRRRRKVSISKKDREIRINFYGGKIKSPQAASLVLQALHEYLYASS